MEKLEPLHFNLFPSLVVDLMHEFELGIWKHIFVHLIRLLHAASPGGVAVATLDARYVPEHWSQLLYFLCLTLDFGKYLLLVVTPFVVFRLTHQK